MPDQPTSWDTTQQHSNYHFNTQQWDRRWDTVVGLGRFRGNWHQELQEAIDRSQPATWASRGYKGRDYQVPSQDLEAEERDLDRIGMARDSVITDLTWDIAPVFQRMTDCFGLSDPMTRIHVQWPGQVWNLHIDKLQKWAPDDPDSVMRVMIQLTDWQPGHFWCYGNYVYQGWQAGDATTFAWQHVPHATANAGHSPRVTLQITGVKTNVTDSFLQDFRNAKYHSV
jgi:hypothetical protein